MLGAIKLRKNDGRIMVRKWYYSGTKNENVTVKVRKTVTVLYTINYNIVEINLIILTSTTSSAKKGE